MDLLTFTETYTYHLAFQTTHSQQGSFDLSDIAFSVRCDTSDVLYMTLLNFQTHFEVHTKYLAVAMCMLKCTCYDMRSSCDLNWLARSWNVIKTSLEKWRQSLLVDCLYVCEWIAILSSKRGEKAMLNTFILFKLV